MRAILWGCQIRALAECRCAERKAIYLQTWITDEQLRDRVEGFAPSLIEMQHAMHRLIDDEMLALCPICGGERREVREGD